MRLICTTLCLFIFAGSLFAQNDLEELQLIVQKTDVPPNIDGSLDDDCWQKALDVATNFQQYLPYDTCAANKQTEIRMCYDDKFLYVAFTCYSTGPDFVVQSLRRDYSFPNNDNVTLLLDTYNDGTNSFAFGINPYGVRREALVANGGRVRGDFNSSWDNKWFGNAQRHEDSWTAEMAIPFKTLRFQQGATQWRFNCYRNDSQANEWSTWNAVSRNFRIMDHNYMGSLIWSAPLANPGTNISLIPYASAQAARDFEDPEQTETDWNTAIGGDAKVAITPGLNLDLTINPDFSQVEVDRQVTNLDRFEIFFPERRQFFLENADLFSSFGLSRVNPFFSRRIGVAIDSATGTNVQNAIRFGARLSGKVNEDLRVGLLNMQAAPVDASGLPGFNYTVAAVQQQVFARSNIAAIFVNKQATVAETNPDLYDAYNRVAGLEYRLATPTNEWTGKTFFHQVFSPDPQDHAFAHGLQIEHLQRRWRVEWAHNLVGNGFDAEVGFVPRRDYFLMSPEVQLFFFPAEGLISQHSINLDTRFFLQIGKAEEALLPDWTLSEQQFELNWNLRTSNNLRAGITLEGNDLTLLNDFDPTRLQEEDVFLPAGNRYQYLLASAFFNSDDRKTFSYQIQPTVGSFFNGFRAGVRTEINWRYQPYGTIALTANYNYIKLADPFIPVNLWVVGPRIDLTFSKTLFLTTFFQYNNQLDNLNINARLQWRYAPVSDLFLVYTDNYLTAPFSQFGVRNRAFVAKITYWLNL